MERTVFNPVQQHLLKLFAYDSSEETLRDIQDLIAKYLSEKIDRQMDELWESGVLNQEKLDELRGMHIRDILNRKE